MKAGLKEIIRNEYVHGHTNDLGQRIMPTLEDLITKHKVAASTVYRISSKDKWKDQRNAFRKKLREEIDLKKTEELQSKLYKSDEISAEIAHEIFNKIKELLRKEDQISPNGLASVSSSALTAQKLIQNTSPSIPSSSDSQSGFLDAMKILDEIAALKRSSLRVREVKDLG